MFRLALHSVSYAGIWAGQARLSLFEFIDKAGELGFDAVMLMAKRPHLSVLDISRTQQAEIKQRLQDHGLKVACLAGYTDFTLGAERPDIPTREMQILYVRELARLASELHCPLIRVFTGYSTSLATYDQQWNWCVESLRDCARQAADFGVTIGVQNHHDNAVHHEALLDLIREIDHPQCQVMFDAWAPALQGHDPVVGVRDLAPHIVHTTVADYVRRPRFKYLPQLVNYAAEPDSIRAVPMGEGFIDYASFFKALRATGYRGYVTYEMCSMLRGGGSIENLDRCAIQFREYMRRLSLDDTPPLGSHF
ncbi:MAG: sugar phosphate isomerase/epimerase family protein [Planctomycetota bacterium]